jgi:hypothetical protein
LEGNVNLKEQERQERQMRGYPLRSFSANNPVIILPDKFGGLPLYTRNQTEYSDFCSSFTAPMSLPLQNDTILLGREGYSVSNDSASKPFEELGFEMNMHKSNVAIDYNEAIMQQRKYIMGKRERQGMNVGQVTGGSKSQPSTIRGSGLAVGIGARGQPQFGENADAMALLQKSFDNEGLFGDMAEETAFEMSKQQQMFARQRAIGKKGVLENDVPRRIQDQIADQVIMANPNQPEVGLIAFPRKRFKIRREDLQRSPYLMRQRNILNPAIPRGVEQAATAATAGQRNAIIPRKVSDRHDNADVVQRNETPAKVDNSQLTGMQGRALISGPLMRSGPYARAAAATDSPPISPGEQYQRSRAGARELMNTYMARGGGSI